ncbi:MAG: adenosylcobinamide-GDP ribazoletransferase [Gammaproteobacteria bacterium]|nr:adenosylcobinamide-GDP ribazoletransferase [Gammaproteobacteria bacterium]
MQPLWLALQFLTRLPTPHYAQVSPQAVGRSLLFYPLVGLLIGALLYAATLLTAALAPLLQAALLLALWLLLSGALHIDGVADMADAWVGGQGDRERTLAIMKDPYCGPMGVSAVVAVLLLKFAALTELLVAAPLLLLLPPVVGRSFAILLLLTTPYCREAGLASDMVRHLPRRAAWLLLAVVVAATLLWLPGLAPWVWGVSALLFVIYRRALMQRLQGFTGDSAGALIEGAEVVTLLLAAGMSGS